MRARIALGVLVAGFAFGTNAFAQGQGTINDGAATYIIPAAHYDITPTVTFRGVGGVATTNHMFESGWWYRIAGDAAEKFFPVPGSANFPAGTSYTVTWTNVDARNFNAQEVGAIVNGGAPSGQVTFDMTITNTAASALTIDLFHMADFDVNGFAGDSGVLVNANDYIRINDGGGQFGEYRGIGATAFIVRPFGDPNDVAGLLSNAAVNNFDNSGLPFAAGDFTGGFQWAGLSVPAAGSVTVRAVLAMNQLATPVELMDFKIQ